MRFLIVSDIHSNLEALQSVIKDARNSQGFDQIWHLGDVVGYGPDPEACIDLLREYDHVGVAGNHDWAVLGKIDVETFNTHAATAARWTMGRLKDDHVDYLNGLPLRFQADDFTAVHASPRDPTREYVISKAVAAANFDYFHTERCLVGHSHVPFLCKFEGLEPEFFALPTDTPVPLGAERYIINPGSVGQPRDGLATASYCIYDSEADAITHRRVGYDIAATQQKMRQSGMSSYLIDRLAEGR
jgi:predicted phosphodiesterase